MKGTAVAELELGLARARLERDQLRAMLMEAPFPACIHEGPDHVYTFVNRAWQMLFSEHEVIGKTFREAWPELVDTPIHAALDSVFGAGVAITKVEARLELVGEPARSLFGEMDLQPIVDAENNVTGVASFSQDHTDLVAAQRQLEFLFEEVRLQADELTRRSLAEGPTRPVARLV